MGHGEKSILFECLPAAGVIGGWVHDTATDRVMADHSIQAAFGIADPDTINGDPMSHYVDAVHEEDRQSFAADVRTASLAGGTFHATYRIITQAGVRWVHDYGQFELDAFGRPALGRGIIIDVTATRRRTNRPQKELQIGAPIPASEQVRANLIAGHMIAASTLVRTFPAGRLHRRADEMLLEVGRLLAGLMSRKGVPRD
ncbi:MULTISPECIES: PAS domain-containing protein [Methylobacterium]|uniref:PAS fold-3 domain-containing protein n=2 Tax=Pseudomonadota TaxID=1224 RepID=A0ABQ4T4D8_9HYPH|nr:MULTISPECIES: PAS domain-containing protein [Methylobacterium]PIU05705.1 MAG: hypothetical protein COT56_13775 [Methylobacterium sp. CG09_land_8_20_14_0_10_71_15]PIU12415.1 MAG: hypothetical protein COT28_15620 [Methylobacterium sp. CG08_land_8_20_14_0_20_71_15]GBU16933.1 hypothetical protein AwMethylo_11480 [Methylobacterium sp.]GJE08900.1 hypothetical protein AOPFMNJM_4247 [Methylobacterium jeotgali]